MDLIDVTYCWLVLNEQKGTNKAKDCIKQIPGKNDSIPAELSKKGEVLISYSDCYACHKEDQRSVRPAFKDIAKNTLQTKFI